MLKFKIDREVILFGYSGHSYVAIEILTSHGYAISGYVDPKISNSNPYNINYLGTDEDILKQDHEGLKSFVAIGENGIRKKLSVLFSTMEMIMAIHKNAIISETAKLGKGIMCSAASVINAQAQIGDGVIINTGAIIEHECIIGDYVHIAPGAVLAGNVTVGELSFIGANAVVKQGVKIGSNVVIGAGTVVLNDVENNVVLVGNPGKVQ